MIMATTRLSSKGQIILPKSVRDTRKWGPGTEFSVENVDDGVLLRPVRTFAPSSMKDVLGCLKKPGDKARSIEDMDQSIAKGVRKRHASGRY
jgi:AbrB family looped-hinge helix DNA binding protein